MKALIYFSLVEHRVQLDGGSAYLMAGDQLVIESELASRVEVLKDEKLFRKDSEVMIKGPSLRNGKFEINKGKEVPVPKASEAPKSDVVDAKVVEAKAEKKASKE